jgi:type IV pilus assembly protein PilB
VTEEQMRRALCQQLHINYFDLDTIVPDRSLRGLINPRFAKKRLVVPIARVGQTLVVAMDDPTQTPVVDDLQASTGLDIEVITSTRTSIRRALEQMYPALETPNTPAPATAPVSYQVPTIVGEPNILSFEEIDRLADEKLTYVDAHHASEGTASMVRRLLRLAIEWGASDIHLEAVEHGIQTRFRVDGVLQELELDDLDAVMNQNRAKLMSRLKILSKLDIAERRRPQDGSFRARLARDGQTATVDFRISIIPGYYGESAVIRILDPAGCRSPSRDSACAPPSPCGCASSCARPPASSWSPAPPAPARAPRSSVRSRASTSRVSRSSRPRTRSSTSATTSASTKSTSAWETPSPRSCARSCATIRT